MTISVAEMEKRVVRYADLLPCTNAFIDTRTPGSDAKENFCLIGPGVSEQPGQHIHVKIPHGFNIGGARQPKGCVNSQHSHETAEVFLVHSGDWAFRWGHDGSDGEVVLSSGDVISIPTNLFRGFENVGDDDSAFLYGVLGGDDPGHVTWAPYVFEDAKDHGLVLLADGTLIDTIAGDAVPDGAEIHPPTTLQDVASFRRMSADEMAECVLLFDHMQPEASSVLARNSTGVTERAIIGGESVGEGVQEAKLAWPHDFCFRRIDLAAEAVVPAHSRSEEEVVFVQEGAVMLIWDDGALTLGTGDTATIPIGMIRSYASADAGDTTLFVVRRGDVPAAPIWQ